MPGHQASCRSIAGATSSETTPGCPMPGSPHLHGPGPPKLCIAWSLGGLGPVNTLPSLLGSGQAGSQTGANVINTTQAQGFRSFVLCASYGAKASSFVPRGMPSGGHGWPCCPLVQLQAWTLEQSIEPREACRWTSLHAGQFGVQLGLKWTWLNF